MRALQALALLMAVMLCRGLVVWRRDRRPFPFWTLLALGFIGDVVLAGFLDYAEFFRLRTCFNWAMIVLPLVCTRSERP